MNQKGTLVNDVLFVFGTNSSVDRYDALTGAGLTPISTDNVFPKLDFEVRADGGGRILITDDQGNIGLYQLSNGAKLA